MPELILRLRTDPNTGKRQLTVAYRSEADALPMEHEEEHRRLVEGVFEGGTARAVAEGRVELERESAGEGAAAVGQEEPAGERQSLERKE